MSRCLLCLLSLVVAIVLAGPTMAADPAKPLAKSELLMVLPESCNTPDGMCLYPDGNILLSVPNINDQSQPARIMKVTPANKLEPFYDPPAHPDTGKAFPFGICVGPDGDVYYADLQWFADPKNPNYKSRVMRIPMKDGKPGKAVVFASGMVVANAVIIRGGYLYVSDTLMLPGTDPVVSGVFRFKLDEEGVEVKRPLDKDAHLIATIKSFNTKVGFGADGLTFDSKGNLYIGNFADGTLHRVEFDKQGCPQPATIFAKAPFMKSCDGILCDVTTDKIYVADSIANAIQIVNPDGSVQCLCQDPENDGKTGQMDQPCEPLLRGGELIISNFDFPVPGGVNTKYEAPNTICKVRLK
jgi:sugar lactone lactonase YvrE